MRVVAASCWRYHDRRIGLKVVNPFSLPASIDPASALDGRAGVESSVVVWPAEAVASSSTLTLLSSPPAPPLLLPAFPSEVPSNCENAFADHSILLLMSAGSPLTVPGPAPPLLILLAAPLPPEVPPDPGVAESSSTWA